jgi:NO-binding membrane sensor protein with MHYT domain
MPDLAIVIGTLLTQTPFLIVAIVGLWLATSRRQRHLRVSKWAAIAFVCLIAQSLVRIGIQFMVFESRTNPPSNPSQFARELIIWNVVAIVLLVVALGMLTCAVFRDRPRTPAGT